MVKEFCGKNARFGVTMSIRFVVCCSWYAELRTTTPMLCCSKVRNQTHKLWLWVSWVQSPPVAPNLFSAMRLERCCTSRGPFRRLLRWAERLSGSLCVLCGFRFIEAIAVLAREVL